MRRNQPRTSRIDVEGRKMKKDIMLRDVNDVDFLSYIFPRTSAFSAVDNIIFVLRERFLTADGADLRGRKKYEEGYYA